MPMAGQPRSPSRTSTQRVALRDGLPLRRRPSPRRSGRWPGCRTGRRSAAPAPSPKMKAEPRSLGSVKSESFSTPTTRTWRALPPRTMSLARLMRVAVARAGGRDVEGGAPDAEPVGEDRCGRRRLVGVGDRGDDDRVDVGRLEPGRGRGPRGWPPRTCRRRVSSLAAKRRLLMPDRSWIHSSEESIASMSSEFITTRSGR